MFEVKVENLKKTFNRKVIFDNLNFQVDGYNGLGIIGKNGSGKTTLLKILAGLLEPTAGVITYTCNTQNIEKTVLNRFIGFVSPYLNLYDEFSALENLKIFDGIRNIKNSHEKYEEILDMAGLLERKKDFVRDFSSGMKQRLKFAFALINQPEILFLDEPSTNLDMEGIEMMNKIMIDQRKKEKILVIATNDMQDLKCCNVIIDLNKNNNNNV